MKLLLQIIIISYLAVVLCGCRPNNAGSPNPGAVAASLSVRGITPHQSDPNEASLISTNESIEIHADTNLYDITFDNTPLTTIISEFATLPCAVFITTPGDLGGTVTVNLTGVPWKPALESILSMNNLILTEKMPGSGVYTITRQIPGQPEPLFTKAYIVDSPGDATELAAAVREIWGTNPSVRVAAIPSRNSVIVLGTHFVHQDIKQILDLIDKGAQKK